jgi:ABC-type Fe3+/spermidine/putrescine transport system ATPase subunit
VLEVGSPENLYEHPQTRFVADFLGTMNVFNGSIHARDGDSYIVETRELGRISAHTGSQDFSPGEKICVALRPENLQIVTSQSMAAIEGSISGVVSNTAYFGDSAQIYIELQGSDQPLVVSIQNLDGAASKVAHGDRDITIGWSKSSVLLLKDV